MIKGLTNYEKYKVIRPVIGECDLDENFFPIIKKTEYRESDWCNIEATGLQNASPSPINSNKMLLMFNYDKRLNSLWNNPLKMIGLFQSYFAIATPDYSIYPNMNINDIRHNIYKSRWLGRTWQNYGCTVLPTIGWALPDTYDLAFSGFRKNGIVVISTLGCQDSGEMFFDGFYEMKRRLEPSLIIVYGDMIDGMTGRFLNIKYSEAFSSDCIQLRIEGITKVFEIMEDK